MTTRTLGCMSSESRSGRPKASSRETLAEAACELFLEQGFEATSIADITTRAGVSRSSFFNYFARSPTSSGRPSTSASRRSTSPDVTDGPDAAADVRGGVASIAAGFAPDSLALALVNAGAMGLDDELEREAAVRRSRIARIVAERLRRGGSERLDAEVAGSGLGRRGARGARGVGARRRGAHTARAVLRPCRRAAAAATVAAGIGHGAAAARRRAGRPSSKRRSRSIGMRSGCRRPRPMRRKAARAW